MTGILLWQMAAMFIPIGNYIIPNTFMVAMMLISSAVNTNYMERVKV